MAKVTSGTLPSPLTKQAEGLVSQAGSPANPRLQNKHDARQKCSHMRMFVTGVAVSSWCSHRQKCRSKMRIRSAGRASDSAEGAVNPPHDVECTMADASPSLTFQSFSARLCFPSDKLRASLAADCREVMDTGGSPSEGEEDWAGMPTYWVPMGAQPRCALEQLAGDLFDWHVARLGLGRSGALNPHVAGSEWWSLWLDGEQDDVDWHWDVDGGVRRSGEIRHPFLSTVTYLEVGGSGAPTAVIEDCHKEEVLLAGGVPVDAVHLSLPVRGKHICFDGKLLHAAPRELEAVFCALGEAQTRLAHCSGVARVTLLVNIWLSRHPEDAKPLPAELAERLTPASETSLLAGGNCLPASIEEFRVNKKTSLTCSFGILTRRHLRITSWLFGCQFLMRSPLPRTALHCALPTR